MQYVRCASLIQNDQASAFFFTTRFAFAGAAAAAPSFFFLEALRFNLALMAWRFLDTPKECLQRFPFFDFLSPFPM